MEGLKIDLNKHIRKNTASVIFLLAAGNNDYKMMKLLMDTYGNTNNNKNKNKRKRIFSNNYRFDINKKYGVNGKTLSMAVASNTGYDPEEPFVGNHFEIFQSLLNQPKVDLFTKSIKMSRDLPDYLISEICPKPATVAISNEIRIGISEIIILECTLDADVSVDNEIGNGMYFLVIF